MNPQDRKLVAARALGMVDLTDLNEDCNHAAIDTLCARAQTPFGHVAAICIWPRYVAYAQKRLAGSGIPIATVVNFPGGNQSIEMTKAETETAIADGADEIDLVMPYQAFSKGDELTARHMVSSISETCRGRALLKVILETGELGTPGLIETASQLAIACGADFIKTSTGKVETNATPKTAEIMLNVIAGCGKDIGFKPAGGIKTTEDAAAYLALADQIMGTDWANPSRFRFGASSVLDDLLSALDGGGQITNDGY